jgi:hypothetical protein
MSCCPIQVSRALLIGPGYILSEVVVRCLSIAQCAPIQAPICPVGSDPRSDCAEVHAEVEYDLMKRSHI